MTDAREHYDAVAKELRKTERALRRLHKALGAAWDDYRAANPGQDFGARSGGSDKPKDDDGKVPPGED